jgi:hypothetical protein
MTAATPASVHATEALLFAVLVQLIIMIGAARAMNVVFRRLGQPGVIGDIVAGLMLGPSLFGHFFPEVSVALFGAKPLPAITVLSQLGLTLLMFQIGSDFEFSHLKSRTYSGAVGWITLASLIERPSPAGMSRALRALERSPELTAARGWCQRLWPEGGGPDVVLDRELGRLVLRLSDGRLGYDPGA